MMNANKGIRHNRRSTFRMMFLPAILLLLAGTSQSAFAGQWIQTGRVQWVTTEGMQPYPVFWNNFCHGGVQGPSGVYTYGEWGPEGLGSCPTDTSTGWQNNLAGSFGYCRPEPNRVGGGYSCEEFTHTISGVPAAGKLPATCSTPGTYAVSYSRRAELVYFGNGNMPDDYYDVVSESSAEYYCQ